MHQTVDFSTVLSSGRVIRGLQFDLVFLPCPTNENSRLGLIVPKRLAKASSLRNAIKRQSREAFRLSGLDRVATFDVVLRLWRPIKMSQANAVLNQRRWRAEIDALFIRLLKLDQ